MRATGQSVWTIITCGIAPVIGSLGAGVLSDAFGMRQMFGVICAILIAMTLLFAVLFSASTVLTSVKNVCWHRRMVCLRLSDGSSVYKGLLVTPERKLNPKEKLRPSDGVFLLTWTGLFTVHGMIPQREFSPLGWNYHVPV